MNNTMKRRMIAFVAAIAAVVSLSGCDMMRRRLWLRII